MCDYNLSEAVAPCRRDKELRLRMATLNTFLVFSLPHTIKQGCCCVCACNSNTESAILTLHLRLVQGPGAAKHYFGRLSLLKLLARAESASSAGHTGSAASYCRG